jgi:hypothetical protein
MNLFGNVNCRLSRRFSDRVGKMFFGPVDLSILNLPIGYLASVFIGIEAVDR